MKVQRVVNGVLTEIDEPDVDDDGNPIVKPEVDDEGNPIAKPEVELDDDGNPIEPEVEPWQKEDPDDVPIATHIHMKQKLKGKLSKRDDELEALRLENEKLKNAKPAVVDLPKRPKRDDFGSDELYEAALRTYETAVEDARFTRLEQSREIKERQRKASLALTTAVDDHYERAGKLIEKSGVDEKLYQQADQVVRLAVEAIRPKQGDLIVDQLIQLVGEGSEKVFYFLGRNKTALTEVKSLIAEDPTGMKAAVFLGQQKERLLNPKKPTSRASAPSANPKGDMGIKESKKIAESRKKYVKAHKDGNLQAAFDLKREARLAGADTSKWHEET